MRQLGIIIPRECLYKAFFLLSLVDFPLNGQSCVNHKADHEAGFKHGMLVVWLEEGHPFSVPGQPEMQLEIYSEAAGVNSFTALKLISSTNVIVPYIK